MCSGDCGGRWDLDFSNHQEDRRPPPPLLNPPSLLDKSSASRSILLPFWAFTHCVRRGDSPRLVLSKNGFGAHVLRFKRFLVPYRPWHAFCERRSRRIRLGNVPRLSGV